MTSLSSKVLSVLKGKTLATAESLTGGAIGAALTAVPGSSEIYKGGIISYTNSVKEKLLGVPHDILERYGAISPWIAGAMVSGVRKELDADVAISVTGLAGPGGDEFGNPVGTVYIGYEDSAKSSVHHFCFSGDREAVRRQTIEAALRIVLENNQ